MRCQMNSRAEKRQRGRVPGATVDAARGLRFLEECEIVFRNAKRTQVAASLGCGESSVRAWEKGVNIDNRALAALSRHGADIHYILTGERQAQAKAHAPRDPLAQIIDPPASCPNHGLCRRLAMLVQLQKVLLNGELQGELVEVAIRAVAAYRAERVRPTPRDQVETFEQGPVVVAEKKEA